MTMLVIALSLTGCETTQNTNKIFNRDGMYVINKTKGKVELYSKDKGTNTFSYFGWKDLDTLEGYSINYVDWSKE